MLSPRQPGCSWGLALLSALLMGAPAQAQMTVYSSGNVALAQSRQLTAYVPLVVPTVTWSVNGLAGGNAQWGTVDSKGLYQAPASMPANNAVKVSATSTAEPGKSASVTLTVTQVQPRLWGSSPRSVAAGTFALTLNGQYFTPNVLVRFGGVVLATTWVSATELRATGSAGAAQVGSQLPLQVAQTGLGGLSSDVLTLAVTAAAPAPAPTPTPTPSPTPTPAPTPGPTPAPGPGTGLGTPDLSAARWLEQAAFGPTPAALARVKLIGKDAWLNEQLLMPETAIALPASGGISNSVMQAQYLNRLAAANDQLRQRMAYALGQVLVVSMNKNVYPNEIVPHLQLLSRHAFGNYRALLGELATSPQMGKYLDIANSNKPGAGGGANENFARELMQLFSIGLIKLKPDGSVLLNAGSPVPTYDQTDVQQLALAFTGWTYAGAGNNNWENFNGPLQPRDVNHDPRAKAFLGCALPAGQTTRQDMTAALDCVFVHPNVGPFLATRLIRSLVSSNPSPAYVQRVAAAFDNNGAGVRGDLRAVLQAVLLDAEARDDAASANSGRLKDPIFHILGLVRALGGTITATNQQAWSFTRLSETPLAPASVFSFYSPLFRVPHSALFGPEFQIYSPTEAVLRGNLVWDILSSNGGDFPLDLSRFVNLGGNTAALIDAVDQTLLYGRMPQAMRQSLANAMALQGDNRSRALTALYLTTLSGQHAVQY